jgi:hypothetical protein
MLRTAKEIVYSKQPTTPTPNSYTIQKVRRIRRSKSKGRSKRVRGGPRAKRRKEKRARHYYFESRGR